MALYQDIWHLPLHLICKPINSESWASYTPQVISAQLGQTILQLIFKISWRSHRKLVLSVAAFVDALSGSPPMEACTRFVVFHGNDNLSKLTQVPRGVTKFLPKHPSWGNLDQFGQKDFVQCAWRWASKSRQVPLTEASNGADLLAREGCTSCVHLW